MSKTTIALIALVVALVAATPRARACDVCAIYTATEMHEARTGFRLGVGEQFSRFATLQDDGEELDNPGEKVHSSITQVLLGYQLTPRFGLQLNLPLVSRTFRRLEEGRVRRHAPGRRQEGDGRALLGHRGAHRDDQGERQERCGSDADTRAMGHRLLLQ